jgi:hypothetical protein
MLLIVIYTYNKKFKVFQVYFVIDSNFLNKYFKILEYLQNFNKIHENLMTRRRYIPLSTKNMKFDFYLNIRWQN